MSVNISAKFTKESRPYDGLEVIAADLVDDDKLHETHLVVARISPKFYKANAEDGTRTPTIRIDHVEVVTDERAEQVRQLLAVRFRERTGREVDEDPPSPFDDEVPEPSAEEILAERAERRAAEGEG